MASRFWVGGTGTWDASDTTHWAATSGGTGGETVPTSSDTVTFDSNSGTAATVTIATNAAVASTVTINKSDLTLLCNHTLTVSGAVTFTAGTLNTNGQTMTWGNFDSSNSNTRTLTMGSSAIAVTGGNGWSTNNYTNLTITANTAVITLSAAATGFLAGNNTISYNGTSLVFNGSGAPYIGTAGGGATFANVTRTGTATKTDSFLVSSGPFTCTGTFTVTGNSATNRLLVASNTLGTARTITAATTSLTNVDFRDITGAGAATWSGTSVGNALGNTGITFTTPVTRYAVATGNVSGTGTWSDTSGGASGASVPLCHDTIICNAASGAITVTNDMPRLCADLTCTGFTGTLANASLTAEVYGSLTLASGMTLTGAARVSFYGRSSHTLTTAGKASTWPWTITASGGTYTLSDALTISADSATALRITTGTFADGGFSWSLTGAGAAFFMDGGTLTASGTTTIASTTAATPWTGAGTVNHTGTIVLSGATATDRTFAGGGKTYGTLTDQNTSTGKLTITGQNTFGTINKTAAAACTLALPTSSGITVTTAFNVNGILGALLTVTGDVTKVSGNVICSYLNISSSDAAGGATFYAGRTSTDGGGNTGWLFVDYVTGVLAGSGTGAATATGTRSVLGTLTGSGTGAGTATGTRSVLGTLTGSGTGAGTVTGHSVGPTPATSTPEAA